MRYFYLTFFCLFLLRPAPSYQDDRDDESDLVEDNSHMYNSVINIPGDDSSGDEGTTIEISFQADEPQEDTVGTLEKINMDDSNIVSKRSGERFGYGNRRSTGLRRGGEMKKLTRNYPNGVRTNPMSMLGAAINVLNPMPYFRESFNGFRSVLRHNIKPFRQLTSKPGDQHSHPSHAVKTRIKSPRPPPVPETDTDETEPIPNTTTPAPVIKDGKVPTYSDSVGESSGHTNNGFSLQIPPELANYSALEVNLKPNGEIDIVPVEKNDSYSKNLVSQTTSNQPIIYPLPFNPQVPRKHSATNHFNSFTPNSVFSEFARPSSKVKLVTDSPMVVNSIQDIIRLHNLVGIDNNNAKSYLNNLLRDNPIPVDVSQLFGDSNNSPPRVGEQLPNSFQNPQSPEHIYLLPFKVNDGASKTAPLQSNSGPATSLIPPTPPSSGSEEDASEIYYIDITIPGNAESRPVVNHQRFKRKNGKLVRKRRRRSTLGESNKQNNEGDNRRIRYVDYNGWRPLDIVDPMLNEPTFIYKPPSLQRVHFGEGPPEEKPMFPILPVNPTVYVVRAEAMAPAAKRHAIYGTENVDYLHINPQSNSAKVYSSFHDVHNENSSNDNLNQSNSNTQKQPAKVAINVKEIIKENVPSETITNTEIEYEIEDELENTTEEIEVATSTADENDHNLNNSTNEQLFENENIIPVSQNHKSSESDPLEWLKNPFYKFAEILRAANLTINEVENETIIEENPKLSHTSNLIKEEQQFSDKTFTVGDGNYYYVYEDSEYEPDTDFKSTDFEDLTASGSDPFASIIPKAVQASDEDLEDPYVSPNETDENLKASGSQKVEEPIQRAPLHERLKNFGGVQIDRYIFSASENEKQFSEAPPTGRYSSFRFRTDPPPPKNLRSETGRKIEATSKGKTPHREWYLIETRTEEPPPKKKKVESQNSRRSDFSDRYPSKYSDSPYIYNRYLDDHLKSFKPTEGLTANSLSELLQIFKYVTTPAPNQGKSLNDKDRRTFRYTKPTTPPRYTTAPPLMFTTFRYTIAEPDYPTYTELPFDDIGVLEGPLIVLNDSVAETNSLDGYLFSDSVASPEYKKIDLQPNFIRFNPKDEALVRFDKIAEETGMMDKHAVRRGELSPTLVIDAPKNSEKEKDSFDLDSSAYHIYEGHSKVKIFGSNVDENGTQKKEDSKRAKSLTQNPYKFYDHITTLPPGVVIRPIGMMSVHSSFKNRGSSTTEKTTSTRSTSAIKSFSATLPPDVFTRSQYYATENERLSSVGKVTNLNAAQKKAYLQSNNDESFIHFPTDFYDYYSLHGNGDPAAKAKDTDDDINIDVYPERKLITHNFKYSRPPYPQVMPNERLLEESPKSTTTESTERILDLSSLPSSIESFSKLILSYFSRNNEKEIPAKDSISLKDEKFEDKKQIQFDDKQDYPKPDKKLDFDNDKDERSLADYLSYLKSLEANK